MNDEKDPHHHTRRDAESMMMLGGFMTILAIPVLIGTVFADNMHSQIVNVTAGLVLLAIGVGFFLRGRKFR